MVDPSRPRGFATSLASALDRACTAGAWLAVPLALLLFAQWPLRDLVGAWSRDANDAAQWIFALYVALALRAATRARAHMAAGLVRRHGAGRWRRAIDRYGEAILVLPWALFVVASSALPTWRSLAGLEAFPDTFNPLYFLIRCAAWLLAFLVLVQALLALVSGRDRGEAQ